MSHILNNFYSKILPSNGWYIISITLEDRPERLTFNKTFNNIQDLIGEISKDSHRKSYGIYNASYFNKEFVNKGFTNRIITNPIHLDRMTSLSCDIDDIPSVKEATETINSLCLMNNKAKPIVVSSGRGIHLYWLLKTPITTDKKLYEYKLQFSFLDDSGYTIDWDWSFTYKHSLLTLGSKNFKKREIKETYLYQDSDEYM